MSRPQCHNTPLAIFAKDGVAGLGATVLVSILSRLTFGIMDVREHSPTPRRHPAEAVTPGEPGAGNFAIISYCDIMQSRPHNSESGKLPPPRRDRAIWG